MEGLRYPGVLFALFDQWNRIETQMVLLSIFLGELGMDIHQINKIQSLRESDTTKPKTNNTSESTDFASLLKERTEKAQGVHVPTAPSSHEILSPMLDVELNGSVDIEETASKLLDSLENYQNVLSDPDASLRQVQPVVDDMKAQADKVEPLVQEMPSGNVVKDVIEETLLQINKEYIRFNSGVYVDG